MTFNTRKRAAPLAATPLAPLAATPLAPLATTATPLALLSLLVLLGVAGCSSCNPPADRPLAATTTPTSTAAQIGTAGDDAVGSTPPGKSLTHVTAQADEVLLTRKLKPQVFVTPRAPAQLQLLTALWAGSKERGTLDVKPGNPIALHSVHLLSRNSVAVRITAPYTARAVRHYGNARAPGVEDDQAERRDIELAPGDPLSLTLVRPDGGCIYRLSDGLATLPCLPETVATATAQPEVTWGAGTPAGLSGAFWWQASAWIDTPQAVFTR